MKNHFYKLFAAIVLSISCILFVSTFDTFSLLAYEGKTNKTNQGYTSEGYSFIINSSTEEIIDSILNDEGVFINGQITINDELISINNYLNVNSISRFEVVKWLSKNSIFNEEQKIDCYCELINNRNLENLTCLESVFDEIIAYKETALQNNGRSFNDNIILFDKIDKVLASPFESKNTRSISNEETYSSTNFRIHYDSESTNQSEAIEVADYFETIRTQYLSMNFELPILEALHTRYQVYLDPDSDPDGVASAVCRKKSVLTKTCSSDIVIYGFESLTNSVEEDIAHEYFHAIQNAYNHHSSWFKEACANWGSIKTSAHYEKALYFIQQYIDSHTYMPLDLTNGYEVALFPLTIEKNYGGHSVIRSIYEVYNDSSFELNFEDLKDIITDGIQNNGYSVGSFDDAYIKMATYLIKPSKHFSSVMVSSSLVPVKETKTNYTSYINNSDLTTFSNDIYYYGSEYYHFDTNHIGTTTFSFEFSFDYTGSTIQVYSIDNNDQETISYYQSQNTTISISTQNVKEIYIVVNNICVSSLSDPLSMDMNVIFSYGGNHIFSCTSTGPLSHNCSCSCGYSYTEQHIFQPFKAGHRCKKCLYYTTGPIIETQSLKDDENE